MIKKGTCCHCATEGTIHEYTANSLSRKPSKHTHCKFCFETLIGNACEYPDQHEIVTPAMLATAVNFILKEIKRSKK